MQAFFVKNLCQKSVFRDVLLRDSLAGAAAVCNVHILWCCVRASSVRGAATAVRYVCACEKSDFCLRCETAWPSDSKERLDEFCT